RHTASSARGTPPTTRDGGAKRQATTLAGMSAVVYGARPVSNWYNVAPRLNTSLAGPTCAQSPRACSGLMYAHVPITWPGTVASAFAAGGFVVPSEKGATPQAASRASPQSMTSVSP